METIQPTTTTTKQKSETPKSQIAKSYTLTNGTEIPALGFGTYKLESVEDAIENAIKMGYRLFDTAKFYENEEQIGLAINKCISKGLVKRSELFISTKLWMDDLADPEQALRAALTRLNLDYVDVYFYHWPLPHCENGEISKMFPLHETWRKLEACVAKKLTRCLGISNFNVQLILDLLSYCKVKPALLQVELHPLLAQPKLRQFCERFGIKLVAYNPILRGASAQRHEDYEKFNLFNNATVLEIGEKYGKSATQVILNWHLKNKVVPIPKSSTYSHQLENYESLFFEMEENDYALIDGLNLDKRFNFSREKPFSAGIEVFI